MLAAVRALAGAAHKLLRWLAMWACALTACARAARPAAWLQGLLDVSLSAPGRVTLPRAPPHTLLLSGSVFSPFPAGGLLLLLLLGFLLGGGVLPSC